MSDSKIEKSLDEIKGQLGNVLTKSDVGYVKDLIREPINEMKKTFFEAIERRVEILDGKLHDLGVKKDEMEIELQKKSDEIEALKECAEEYIKPKRTT